MTDKEKLAIAVKALDSIGRTILYLNLNFMELKEEVSHGITFDILREINNALKEIEE